MNEAGIDILCQSTRHSVKSLLNIVFFPHKGRQFTIRKIDAMRRLDSKGCYLASALPIIIELHRDPGLSDEMLAGNQKGY
jgi:hypothetical protein